MSYEEREVHGEEKRGEDFHSRQEENRSWEVAIAAVT